MPGKKAGGAPSQKATSFATPSFDPVPPLDRSSKIDAVVALAMAVERQAL
jgi:hypothetical protein